MKNIDNNKKSSTPAKKSRACRKAFLLKLLPLMMVITAVILFLVIMNSSKVRTNAGVNTGTKYYKSVMIEKGDTLWSLASENLSDGQNNIKDLIAEIKAINGLERDEITYGASLIIPYYGD